MIFIKNQVLGGMVTPVVCIGESQIIVFTFFKFHFAHSLIDGYLSIWLCLILLLIYIGFPNLQVQPTV